MFGLLTSCHSQSDLLALKFGDKINDSENKINSFIKGMNTTLGLYSYQTKELSNYKIDDINLSTYEYPNGNLADHSTLELLIENKEKPNYLGFQISSVKKEEGQSLIAYFKKMYPKFEYKREFEKFDVYFWDIPETNAWIFIDQSSSFNKKNENFLVTHIVYVKRGTKLANSEDESAPTLWQQYHYLHP